jgi:hypothetical protein
MGTETIPDRANSTVIDQSWFNIVKSAIKGDWVPRNSSGVATTLGGSIGTSALVWLKAHIAAGYWSVGDLKIHHSFNGAIGPGQGWMLCDGRQITEALYDTEHGAGSWASYVGSSTLTNKYLPDFSSKYPVGASTTQDGSIAITSVGNASNQINLAHTHTTPAHAHKWYDATAAGTPDLDGAGNSFVGGVGKTAGQGHLVVSTVGSDNSPNADKSTDTSGGGTSGSGGSATQSIQPESIAVQYYMRII